MHDPFESVVELRPYPTRAGLRVFGFAAAALCGWFAYLANARFGHAAAGALGMCAVALVIAAWSRPQWLEPLQICLAWLSFPVRWLLAWTALIVVFFAVLTPTAWIVRRLRKPPVLTSGSGWLPVRPRRGKARYFEQS